jgi:hypothetical protein
VIQEKQMILNFPREIKINLLKDALKEGEVGIFLQLSNILLDAPLNQGGIESDVIESIHQEYLDKR